MIHGIPQLQDGRLTRIDMPDLMLRVSEWRKQILSLPLQVADP